MLEDRIAILNKETEAIPNISYEKRIYTVDEKRSIRNSEKNDLFCCGNPSDTWD